MMASSKRLVTATFVAVTLCLASSYSRALERAEGTQVLGRTHVSLPNAGQWFLLESRAWNNVFGGAQVGEFPAEFKIWALLSDTKQLLAIVMMRSTAAHALQTGNTMQWTNNCKPDGKSYIVDATRGSLDLIDCTKVSSRISMRHPWPKELVEAGPKLLAAGATLPQWMLLTEHVVTSNKGDFLQTWVLTSPKFLGAPGDPVDPARLNAILPQTARWADLLGLAGRRSLFSIRGEFKFPDMIFSE